MVFFAFYPGCYVMLYNTDKPPVCLLNFHTAFVNRAGGGNKTIRPYGMAKNVRPGLRIIRYRATDERYPDIYCPSSRFSKTAALPWLWRPGLSREIRGPGESGDRPRRYEAIRKPGDGEYGKRAPTNGMSRPCSHGVCRTVESHKPAMAALARQPARSRPSGTIPAAVLHPLYQPNFCHFCYVSDNSNPSGPPPAGDALRAVRKQGKTPDCKNRKIPACQRTGFLLL